MMLTEEEAKGKWCPFAIASHTDPRRGFRDGKETAPEFSPEFPCIASRCMAWRWATPPSEAQGAFAAVEGTGFCGLAGVPST